MCEEDDRICGNCLYFHKNTNINHSVDDLEHEYVCDLETYDTLCSSTEACGSFKRLWGDENLKVMTDEVVIATLDKFVNEYSAIGKEIRYKHDGYDLSLLEFVNEIKSGTELGNKFKEKLVFMALFELLEVFE